MNGQPIILSWQLGAGRGHIAALRQVAAALGPFYTKDAAIASLNYAGELAPMCAYVYPCAALGTLPNVPLRDVAGASWGQYLGDAGFSNTDYLEHCIKWWHDTFTARKPALVVSDYSPIAQWVALSMGIPVVSVGMAFGQPPAHLATFPQLLKDHAGWHHDEGQLVENVNKATKAFGFKKLERLPQLYDVDRQVLMSFPALDPYAGEGREHYVSPVPNLLSTCFEMASGDEILVYFSTTEINNLPLMAALASLDLPVRAYIPNLKDDQREQLQNAGIELLSNAASLSDVNQRTRLMLNSCQHGTVSLGMALGLPQFVVPQQLEQVFNARQVAKLGCLKMPLHPDVSVDEFRENIRAAYFDDKIAAAAQNLQNEIQPTLPLNSTVQLRKSLEPFLPKAFSF